MTVNMPHMRVSTVVSSPRVPLTPDYVYAPGELAPSHEAEPASDSRPPSVSTGAALAELVGFALAFALVTWATRGASR